MPTFRYVPNVDVRRLLTPATANEIAENTLVDHYNDLIDWAAPRQTDLYARDTDTYYKVKGCVLRRHGIAGFRIGALNRTPKGYTLAAYRPTRNVLLSASETGEFIGIVDERWAYGLRTGACAAVAVKHLMVEEADECAVLGTGHMAYASLLAINEVMPLRKVSVWSRSRERREGFAARMTDELGTDVFATETAEDCVRRVKVVVTATSSSSPFVRREWLSPGVIVYAMGAEQEVETRAYRTMTFMVDDRDQVRVLPDIAGMVESGEYSDKWVTADLAEVVESPAHGRSTDDELIFVRSQGLVSQDVAQAYWIYREAERSDLGISLEGSLVEKEGIALF